MASTSSRKSSQSQTEERQQKEVPIIAVVPNVSATIKDSCVLPAEPALVGDEEDDILTQAFLPPPPKSSFNALNTSVKKSAINYFNSTLLDDRAVDKNPASFFAEMETTPKKGQNSPDIRNIFKMPEKTFTSVRKTSSSASTASTDSDMDLLMCTPQFLRDQMPVSKGDDIRKHILAIKNKKLFGDDVENSDDTEDDRKSKENNCLVQLINVPKDSKDFDKLLPHLKHNNQLNKKTTLTDQQKAAKDARKEYKFNTSFGKEPQTNGKANTSSKSSTYSRDERHAARDKEKEIGDKGKSNKEEKQKSSRKNKHVDVAQTSKDKSMENNHSHTDIRQKEISSGSKQEKAQKSKSSKSRKDDSKEENETSLRSDDPEQKSSARHRHEKGQHNAEKEPQKVENEAPSKRPTRTIQDKDTNKKGGKVENEHEKHKEEQCRDDNKAPSKRPTRAIQEKDTNKKGGKVGRPSRDVADTEEIIIVKQTIQRKPKEAQEVTERPARRRTRQQSADKPPPAEETAKPVRRMTRLKSHTSKESVVTSDDLDSIPTQPCKFKKITYWEQYL